MDIFRVFLFVLVMLFSIGMLIYKRKKEDTIGWKTLLTPICFYSIAVLNMLAYVFDFFGLLVIIVTLLLLFLAAYFMKHLPRKEGQDEI